MEYGDAYMAANEPTQQEPALSLSGDYQGAPWGESQGQGVYYDQPQSDPLSFKSEWKDWEDYMQSNKEYYFNVSAHKSLDQWDDKDRTAYSVAAMQNPDMHGAMTNWDNLEVTKNSWIDPRFLMSGKVNVSAGMFEKGSPVYNDIIAKFPEMARLMTAIEDMGGQGFIRGITKDANGKWTPVITTSGLTAAGHRNVDLQYDANLKDFISVENYEGAPTGSSIFNDALRTDIFNERLQNESRYGRMLSNKELMQIGPQLGVTPNELALLNFDENANKYINAFVNNKATIGDLADMKVIEPENAKYLEVWMSDLDRNGRYNVPKPTAPEGSKARVVQDLLYNSILDYNSKDPQVTYEIAKELTGGKMGQELFTQLGFNNLSTEQFREILNSYQRGELSFDAVEPAKLDIMKVLFPEGKVPQPNEVVLGLLSGMTPQFVASLSVPFHLKEVIETTKGRIDDILARYSLTGKVQPDELAQMSIYNLVYNAYTKSTSPEMRMIEEFGVDAALAFIPIGGAPKIATNSEKIATALSKIARKELVLGEMKSIATNMAASTSKRDLRTIERWNKLIPTIEKDIANSKTELTSLQKPIVQEGLKVSAKNYVGARNELNKFLADRPEYRFNHRLNVNDDIVLTNLQNRVAETELVFKNNVNASKGIQTLERELEKIPQSTFKNDLTMLVKNDGWRQAGANLIAKNKIARTVWGGISPSLKVQLEKGTGEIVQTAENIINSGKQLFYAQISKNKAYTNNLVNNLFKSESVLKFGDEVTTKAGTKYQKVLNVEKIGVVKDHDYSVSAIMENIDRYWLLDDTGKRVGMLRDNPQIKEAKRLLDLLDEYTYRPSNNLNLPKTNLLTNHNYFPRGTPVEGKKILQSIGEHKSVGNKLGKKATEFDRKYPDIRNALDDGYVYPYNGESWRMAVRDRINEVLDINTKEQLADWLKPLGTKNVKSTASKAYYKANEAATYLSRLNIRGKISTTQQEAIGKRSPDLLKAIKEGKSPDELKAILKEEIEKAENFALEQKEQKNADPKLFSTKGFYGLDQWGFDKTVRDSIQRTFQRDKPGQITSGAQKVNQVIRYMKTNFDAGWGLLHGQVALFDNPLQWRTVMQDSLRSMIDPDFVRGFASKHKKTIEEMIVVGNSEFGSAEMMEGIGIVEKGVAKIPKIGQKLEKGIAGFGRGFTQFLDEGRILTYEAHRKPGMTQNEIADLAAVVDNMYGSMNVSKLGLSNYQKAVEGAYLSYAARYRRSGVAFLLDTFRGGIRGGVAREAMGKMAAGSVLAYTAANIALGKSLEETINRMNPMSPDFMNLNISGMTVNLGGQYKSWLKLAGRTVESAINNPDKFVGFIKGKDFGEILNSFNTDPGLRYFRSQAAPLIGTWWSFLSGSDYLGNPTRRDWGDFAKNIILANVIPLTFDNAAMDMVNQNGVSNWMQFPIQFLGANAYEDTASDVYFGKLDDIAKERYGKSYNDLDIKTQKELQNDPLVKPLYDEYVAYKVGKGSGDKQYARYLEWLPEYDELKHTRSIQWYDNERKFKIDGDMERWKARNDEISVWYREQSLNLQTKYKDVYKEFNNLERKAKDDDYMTASYFDYMDTVYGSTKLNGYSGQQWWNEFNKIEKEWEGKWGTDALRYVKEVGLTGRDMPPITKAINKYEIEIGLSGYWDLPRATDADRSKVYQWRSDHPEIDTYLFLSGNTKTLQSQDAYDLTKLQLIALDLNRDIPYPASNYTYNSDRAQLQKDKDMAKAYAGKASKSSALKYNIEPAINTAHNKLVLLETRLKNEFDPDKQKQLMSEIKANQSQLTQYLQLLNSMPNEPHLPEVKAQLQIWLLDSKYKSK